MIANTYTRGGLIKSAGRVDVQQEPTWTAAEMEQMIRRERAVRQQAQLAAEQALTAAKEAQKIILQLEEELDTKDLQLRQERAAREQAEVAAQKARKSAVHAALEATQDKSSEVTKKGCEQQEPRLKSDVDDPKTEDGTEDDLHAIGNATTAASATENVMTPQLKRPREDAQVQTPSVSKKPRGPDKVKENASQDEASRNVKTPQQTPYVSKKPRGPDKVKENASPHEKKMPLAEARRAAQQEVKKRIQERADEIEARKKI
ncbi:hypothetical protein PHYPSEUDO_003400 [Phytophthora pseudosyringae]|uniref:Uncharacterized protein n=1 Tax=Phytophthora pseudosyringae TaxID=221518 RepID=A0A8T1WI59_9STRA|nr:hypothetical protein PHYPSEUDO_003400 [Phytophthora pseudosyringae]